MQDAVLMFTEDIDRLWFTIWLGGREVSTNRNLAYLSYTTNTTTPIGRTSSNQRKINPGPNHATKLYVVWLGPKRVSLIGNVNPHPMLQFIKNNSKCECKLVLRTSKLNWEWEIVVQNCSHYFAKTYPNHTIKIYITSHSYDLLFSPILPLIEWINDANKSGDAELVPHYWQGKN